MKKMIFSLILAMPFLVGTASAKTLSGDVYLKNANFKADANSVGNMSNAMMANRTRSMDLPLGLFHLSASGVPLGSATVPGHVIANNIPALEWAQGETAGIETTFRVPADYVSGGVFICSFSLDAASANTTVDFDIFVNVDGSAFDAAATDQTVVAIANNTTLNQAITFTPVTDTFSAGNFVTFSLNRAAGTGAGSNLNLLNCYLSYTADM